MMRCTISRFVVGFGLTASLIGMLCLSVGMAGAAEVTDPGPDMVAPDEAAPDDEQKLLIVYALRHADGQTVLTTLSQIFADADATITLDANTNRVLVHATRSWHSAMEELIKTLDVPPVAGEKKEKMITLEVYSIKHVDGQTLVSIALQVFPEAVLTFEPASKRLIAYALASDQERLKEFIKRIDVLPEHEEQVKVINLIHAEAAPMAQAVSEILDTEEVRIAVDTRTNSLMAVGPESTLSVIEALLLRLDAPEPRKSEETFRVRIVWFAEGSPDDEAAKLDNDLLAVQAELSRIGVGPFHSMGQVMVNTAPGGEFQIGCPAALGDEPADLKINGALDLERRERPLLTIEITAMRRGFRGGAGATGFPGNERLVELQTDIAAPLGHCVVLGVTPVQEKTLAFAVQVRSEDNVISEDNINERRRSFLQQMKRQTIPKKE